MNKFLRHAMVTLMSICLMLSGTSTKAQTTRSNVNDACPTETVFAFFNGVKTSRKEADGILNRLERIHGTTLPNNESIRYEVMYNTSNDFEDFVETFEQRMREQNALLGDRFELFFEAMNGGGDWWTTIVKSVAAAADTLEALKDAVRAIVTRNLTAKLASPPTEINYQEHRSRIDNFALEGKKMLFVAHSQGNLFANPAYRYAITKSPASAVGVVHVAPASPTLNGPHVLADLDLVINALRLAGSVVSITDAIPLFANRPAGLNDEKDWLGHGMLAIYLNPQLTPSARVKSLITSGLARLVKPAARAATGFFSATLTWNGSGDVDTHVDEPGGAHVWYFSKQGAAGYLDVDNTVADGPEHYYASCDAQKLQTGTYKIGIANYKLATGRTATMQVASYAAGVLGTKSVTLGGVTGDSPLPPLFTVKVTKDAAGVFKAALVN
ncbi:hypothetical protein QN362_10360 [Actimicrobium sp. CCC2.4]|uniref:hypothetical protein n=1 Tax=Actimicrobium sp. CCC2.4 TaxID=3048606 RepID=UPI002AC9CEC3|nr:hypothetical protein [Actimicrobium sp. CCC2.4]MEB0135730.1 hypothetical protein [Actimicrobium sp. CCC2.4]WPX33713.1 hypothetical protein RHM62_07810 [Actimicrobium sp. CCC2.4]